ncbi:MAG: hypothetical protein WD100_13265 [Tistlia sp.]
MPIEKKTTEARQAEPRKTNWHVLTIGLPLGVVALGAVLLWFFAFR